MKKILIMILMVFIFSSFGNALLSDGLEYAFYMENLTNEIKGKANLSVSAGSPALVSGIDNNGYDFEEADNDKFSFDSVFAGDVDSDFTYSFWYKPESLSSLQYIITTGQGILLFRNTDGDFDYLLCADGDGTGTRYSGTFSSQPTISTGVWYHIVMTSTDKTTAGGQTLYINNVSYSGASHNTDATCDTGTYTESVGGYPAATTLDADGIIDELYIYNRSITSNEVSQLYANTKPITSTSNATSFSVSAVSGWSGNTINNFSIEINDNGTIYNTTTGTITTELLSNSSNLYNISFTSNEWFNYTYNNVNVSSNLQGVLNQSVINISAFKEFDLTQVSNYTITLNGTNYTTTNNNIIIYPDEANYVVTAFYDNTGVETYTLFDDSFNVSALDNKSINLSVIGHTINIKANDYLGVAINNFTTSLVALNFTDNRSNTTTNGVSTFQANDGFFNITVDAEGYALQNNSIILYVNNTAQEWNYTFTLYATNSLNITIKDINNGSVINWTNITVEFIGATSQTNVTNTGLLYLDLLDPSEYTIVIDADLYRQNQYIFILNNRSYTDLTLYMDLDNNTNLGLITVYNTYGEIVNNVDLVIQRYFNNSWKVEQIRRTDFQGRTEAYFVLSDEFYNFLVKDGTTTYFGVLNSDENKKQIYTEDINNGIKITIDQSGDSVISSYQNIYDVSVDLTFINRTNTSGYFRFYFDDANNIQRSANLLVKDFDDNIICNDNLTTSTGTIFCFVNTSVTKSYLAHGFIDGESVSVYNTRIGDSDDRLNIEWGSFGFAISFLLILISFFMFSDNPTISVLTGTFAMVGLIASNIIFPNFNMAALSLLVSLGWIVASIKSSSGVNN